MWCFIGNPKGDRQVNTTILKKNFESHFCEITAGNSGINSSIYNNSIFTYCPQGNFNIECSRTYASILNGSIPILHCTDETYDELYQHFDIIPDFPHFKHINDIVRFVGVMINKKDELTRLQMDLRKWYTDNNNEIKKNIFSAIN